MSQVASLWPTEIFTQTVRTPSAIIKEQAEALGQATRNLVEGDVEVNSSGESIHISFNLLVPTMKNYTYRLFSARHGLHLYPVDFVSGVFEGGRKKANDEDEVTAALKTIFNDEKTKRIVVALLAQAQS